MAMPIRSETQYRVFSAISDSEHSTSLDTYINSDTRFSELEILSTDIPSSAKSNI